MDNAAADSYVRRMNMLMDINKIDSLVDQAIDRHEAQEDARSKEAFAKRMKALEIIVKTIMLAVVFGPIIFAFGMLFFI